MAARMISKWINPPATWNAAQPKSQAMSRKINRMRNITISIFNIRSPPDPDWHVAAQFLYRPVFRVSVQCGSPVWSKLLTQSLPARHFSRRAQSFGAVYGNTSRYSPLGAADFFHHTRSKVNSGVSKSEQTAFLVGAYHLKKKAKGLPCGPAVQLQP